MTEKLRLPVSRITFHPDRLVESVEIAGQWGTTPEELAEFVIRTNRHLMTGVQSNWTQLPNPDAVSAIVLDSVEG